MGSWYFLMKPRGRLRLKSYPVYRPSVKPYTWTLEFHHPNGFPSMRIVQEALTFDDVLLLPAHSTVLPKNVSLATQLTRGIRLNIPFVSAPPLPATRKPWPRRADWASFTRT